MIERDYIMRLVQQLAAVLKRIFKLKEQEQHEQALVEAGAAYGELLGMSPELMAAFDSATLAQLLGHHERVKAAAALFRAEGELHQRLGEEAGAQARYQRALELYLEAAQAQTQSDAECVAAVRVIAKLLLPERITPRYSNLMQKLV
jgi:hypothetical protein